MELLPALALWAELGADRPGGGFPLKGELARAVGEADAEGLLTLLVAALVIDISDDDAPETLDTAGPPAALLPYSYRRIEVLLARGSEFGA